MNKFLVRSLWEEYMAVACPKNAPAVQVDETRKAFYAGISATWAIIDKCVNDDLSDDALSKMIESIEDELRDYLNLIKLGVA